MLQFILQRGLSWCRLLVVDDGFLAGRKPELACGSLELSVHAQIGSVGITTNLSLLVKLGD
jgi:hypothetical protein